MWPLFCFLNHPHVIVLLWVWLGCSSGWQPQLWRRTIPLMWSAYFACRWLQIQSLESSILKTRAGFCLQLSRATASQSAWCGAAWISSLISYKITSYFENHSLDESLVHPEYGCWSTTPFSTCSVCWLQGGSQLLEGLPMSSMNQFIRLLFTYLHSIV